MFCCCLQCCSVWLILLIYFGFWRRVCRPWEVCPRITSSKSCRMDYKSCLVTLWCAISLVASLARCHLSRSPSLARHSTTRPSIPPSFARPSLAIAPRRSLASGSIARSQPARSPLARSLIARSPFGPTFVKLTPFLITICRTLLMLELHLSKLICFRLTLVEISLISYFGFKFIELDSFWICISRT